MKEPLVSFVVPTYNRAYILGKAIKSIRNQTLSNWELVLIDDGSTDKTRELAESYQDKRIFYHYQKNQGQAAARNKGLELARGEWIAYLDSDNHLYVNFLEQMLAAIKKEPSVLWAFPKGERYRELWKNGQLLEKIDETEEFTSAVSPQDIVQRKLHTDLNGFIHSRKLVKEGIRFDERLKKMEDWDLFLTLAEHYPQNFLYVDKILYSYSQRYGGDGVVSNSAYGEWAEIFEFIYQKHKNDHLMKDQTWHPRLVEKWKKLEEDFKKGLLPPYHLYYFKEHWPSL